MSQSVENARVSRKNWRKRNSAAVTAQVTKWRQNNPDKFQAQQDRQRERRRAAATIFREHHPDVVRHLNHVSVYGITWEERQIMFEKQDYCCAACKSIAPQNKRGWQLDHDHTKKKGDKGFIRGILCFPCNQAANKHHTPKTLRALADYLEVHQ